MAGVSDEAVEAAENAWHEEGTMRAALEAAQSFMQCSCFVISDVNDNCPQHGRDS